MFEILACGVIVLIFIILTLLYAISHRFMVKPLYFILTGFILCLFSAFGFLFLDRVLTLIQTDKNTLVALKLLKDTFTFSIVSLGGGLMCSGFMIKAQVEYNLEIHNLNEELDYFEKELDELHQLITENMKTGGEDKSFQYIKLLIDTHRRKKELIAKLKKLSIINPR